MNNIKLIDGKELTELWFPVKNCKEITKLMEAWEKVIKVIQSCKTLKHKEHAYTYIDLFINRFNLHNMQEDIYTYLVGRNVIFN